MKTNSLLAIVIIGYAAILLCTAWQCDDAFITFRTAQNYWHSEGLTWNPGERVQAYTSPLWLMVSVICQGIFGEVYFSVLAASILISLSTVSLISFRMFPNDALSVVGLLGLSVSSAVIDYSTSGLENPLLAFLLIVFLIFLLRRESRYMPAVFLVGALIGLTRLDALCFVIPSLAWLTWRSRRSFRDLSLAALALLPLVGWEIFSLVYYGDLVPNTARAKLNLDIPALDLAEQGLLYFVDSLAHDPITPTIVALGLVSGLGEGRLAVRMFSLGILLYMVYVASIGGDFMSGRFLSAATVACVALLGLGSRRVVPRIGPVRSGILMTAIVVYGLTSPSSPWRSGPDYGKDMGYEGSVRPTGIADERAYYYPTTGLLRVLADWPEITRMGLPVPPYKGAIRGATFRETNKKGAVIDEAGFFGYFAGPDKYLIDGWALCEPFLARLPFEPAGEWRIGHYARTFPDGYLRTRMSGTDSFADREMSQLYFAVKEVTSAPLFSRNRWRAIWRLNTGYYK